MDLYMSSQWNRQNEIYFVTFFLDHGNYRLSVSAFERITPYSVYANCVDRGVDVQLCICDYSTVPSSANSTDLDSLQQPVFALNKTNRLSRAKEIIHSMKYEEMDVQTLAVGVHGKDCLYLFRQSNHAGVSYSGINLCAEPVQVYISFHTKNLLLSDQSKLNLMFRTGDVLQIISGIVGTLNKTWNCSIKSVSVKK